HTLPPCFPYTTLFRSAFAGKIGNAHDVEIVIRSRYAAPKTAARPPRRDLAGGVLNAARYQPVSLGQGNERPAPPHQRDREGNPGHQRRHGPAFGEVFRHLRAFLAESAGAL